MGPEIALAEKNRDKIAKKWELRGNLISRSPFPILSAGPISGPIWFLISGRRPET